MKDTLIIYRDWWEALKSLPPELRFDTFDAICAYAFEGKQPEDSIISAVTALMRSAIDRDKIKYEKVCERNRRNGIKGGRPKTQNNPNNPVGILETQNNPKQPDNDYDNEYDNNSSNEEILLKTKIKDIELEKEFDAFREMYPGQKRGLAVELGNLKKKYPKEWKKIIPLLRPAVERLIDYHQRAEAAKASGVQIFVPNYAYLQTWINQQRWEEEFSQLPTSDKNETKQHEEDDYSITDFNAL